MSNPIEQQEFISNGYIGGERYLIQDSVRPVDSSNPRYGSCAEFERVLTMFEQPEVGEPEEFKLSRLAYKLQADDSESLQDKIKSTTERPKIEQLDDALFLAEVTNVTETKLALKALSNRLQRGVGKLTVWTAATGLTAGAYGASLIEFHRNVHDKTAMGWVATALASGVGALYVGSKVGDNYSKEVRGARLDKRSVLETSNRKSRMINRARNALMQDNGLIENPRAEAGETAPIEQALAS